MNSLKIKLKISPPKKDQAQDQHQDDDELEEGEIREANPNPNDNANHNTTTNNNNNALIKEGSRVCHICNKTFCNGKALGGHMRVHTENHHHHHHHNPPKPKQPNASPRPGPDQPFRCNLCYKEFPSQKSLFGHMRSHPDRQWRGMQPPGPGPGSGRVVEVVPPTAAGERLRTMKGWGITGRRGRAGSGGDDERDEEAAGELIMLRGGGERKNGSVTTRIGCKKKRRYDSDELYFLGNLGFLVDDDDDDGNDGGSTEDDDDVMVMMMVVEDIDGKGKDKRLRDLDLKEVRDSKCNTCKKYFSSHQELCGHKCSISVHKCKTCDKTFSSGQALGGHQRCHYMPSSSWSPVQTPTPTPTPSQCDLGRRGNVLEFDLNAAPSLEEDEGAIESTFGIS